MLSVFTGGFMYQLRYLCRKYIKSSENVEDTALGVSRLDACMPHTFLKNCVEWVAHVCPSLPFLGLPEEFTLQRCEPPKMRTHYLEISLKFNLTMYWDKLGKSLEIRQRRDSC